LASGHLNAAPGVSATTITIGLLADLTGTSSAALGDTVGAVKARFALQNVHGGVDGRKLVLVTEDTQSNPATALGDAQNLVADKKVFAVVENADSFFGAYRYLQQSGVPVTGGGSDGPEWGERPNINLFSLTPVDPGYPATTVYANAFKLLHVTKAAGFAYGVSPTSTRSVVQLEKGNTAAHIANCYDTLSIPSGSVDFTGYILALQHYGCDGSFGSMTDASNGALEIAESQGGLHIRNVSDGGYDQVALDNPNVVSAAQGDLVTATIPVAHTKALDAFYSELKRYDPSYKGGIPDLGITDGWMSADLMIKGLEVAGKDPTRKSFIANLRKVTSYNAQSLLATSQNFTAFGHLPKETCLYFAQVKGDGFVPFPRSGKPICGLTVPHSDTA
jgi:branched-chain amino acid transport system substrate-binding protein